MIFDKKRLNRIIVAGIAAAALALSGCGALSDLLPQDIALSGSGSKANATAAQSKDGGAGDVAIAQDATDFEESFPKNEIIVLRVSAEMYGYGTLTGEEQQVYDEMYSCIANYEESITLSTTDVDLILRVYNVMSADHGELFWVDGFDYTTYGADSLVHHIDFAPHYTLSKEQKEIDEEVMFFIATSWLADLPTDASDYEKAKYIFETLIEKVDYDLSIPDSQNIKSVYMTNRTVCQGYAAAAQDMLRRSGIESAIVTGSANNESHAWNLVKLDGEYYYMDVTWGNSSYLSDNASDEKFVNYTYLNMTTEDIARTHQPDGELELPVCTATADNYFVREGIYFEQMDAEAMGAIFAAAYEQKNVNATIKCASSEVYNEMKDYFITNQHIADYCPGILSISYLTDDDACTLTLIF